MVVSLFGCAKLAHENTLNDKCTRVGTYKLHKHGKRSKMPMTLQDGMEGLRLALQVLCDAHGVNGFALGTTHREDSLPGLRRGYYARLGDPAGMEISLS